MWVVTIKTQHFVETQPYLVVVIYYMSCDISRKEQSDAQLDAGHIHG